MLSALRCGDALANAESARNGEAEQRAKLLTTLDGEEEVAFKARCQLLQDQHHLFVKLGILVKRSRTGNKQLALDRDELAQKSASCTPLIEQA